MEKHCTIHANRKAHSICHSCGRSFCRECLNEGLTYYYCNKYECYEKYKLELDYKNNPRFCSTCIDETMNETTGPLYTFNFIGTSFIGKKYFCPICGSYKTSKYFIFLGIPLIKIATYRVLVIDKAFDFNKDTITLLSRKMK